MPPWAAPREPLPPLGVLQAVLLAPWPQCPLLEGRQGSSPQGPSTSQACRHTVLYASQQCRVPGVCLEPRLDTLAPGWGRRASGCSQASEGCRQSGGSWGAPSLVCFSWCPTAQGSLFAQVSLPGIPPTHIGRVPRGWRVGTPTQPDPKRQLCWDACSGWTYPFQGSGCPAFCGGRTCLPPAQASGLQSLAP